MDAMQIAGFARDVLDIVIVPVFGVALQIRKDIAGLREKVENTRETMFRDYVRKSDLVRRDSVFIPGE